MTRVLVADDAASVRKVVAEMLASVYLDSSRLVEVRISGAVDFLAKPFEVRSLLGAVERACAAPT